MQSDASRERFEALYRDQAGRLLLMLMRLTESREDGEDLTQETFIRGWRAWSSFRSSSQPSTWIHTIAMRAFADWCRAPARRTLDDAQEVDAAFGETIAAILPGTDRDLEEAIGRLPSQMRHAVVLHYLEGMPVDCVAKQLGKSSGTIKAQLFTARSRLREALKP